MDDKVQVTLYREDWERIIRLVQGVIPAATQSVDDAYEFDKDGPDLAWIEARQRSLAEARDLSDRVTAAVQSSTAAQ